MPEQSAPLMQLGEARPLTVPVPAAGPAPAERARLERRTRLLAWAGIGWHIVEFAIALAAGVAASSIALIGFGAGRLVEALVGWWWADPLTALVIAAVALKEGRESWRGEGCCDAC